MAFFDELLDHRDLLGDVLHGTGLDMGWQALEEVAVVMEFFRPEAGELREGLTSALRFADRFIVHIGEVADVQSAQAAGFQRAAEDILEHESAEIADMGGAINGRAAAVKPERLPIDGRQILDFPCQSIIQTHASP